VPLGGAGNAAGKERFVQMRHFDELVLDMGGLIRAIVIRRQRRRADEDVAHADLAAAVALAMVAGKPLDQHAAEFILAAHQDVFPGNENVVEDHQGFMAAKPGVADVNGAAFQFPRVAGLAAVNVEDALFIRRADEGYGIVRVVFGHGDGGHDQNPVGVDGAGLMGFGAPHDDALVVLLDDMDIQIRVGLLMRRKSPVSLDVGHGAVHGKVFFLNHFQKFDESLMIFRAELLIHLIGGAVHGVHGIHADAPLKAGGGLLPQKPLHFDFLDEVVGALMQMGETVDFIPG